MPSSNQSLARFAQVSDTHFIQDLTEQGRMHFRKQFLTRSHAFGKIEALGDKFFELENPRWGREIEILIATGDISTDGDKGAFQTALDFFQSQDIFDNQGVPITFGLNKNQRQRIVLPGNHDRYTGWFPTQGASYELENVFKPPGSYPYVLGYRPPGFTSKSDPTFLFFVFDSTLDPNAPAWAWNRIARGRVEDSHCRAMLQEIRNIQMTEKVMGMNGKVLDVYFDKTFRIALLHHHPKKDGRGGLVSKLISGVSVHTSKMENARLFIRRCFEAGIDLILFGHQHQEYYNTISPPLGASWPHSRPTHDMYYFCCLSTSEYSEKVNGFYLIDFFSQKFEVTPYHWTGSSFDEQPYVTCHYKRSTF